MTMLPPLNEQTVQILHPFSPFPSKRRAVGGYRQPRVARRLGQLMCSGDQGDGSTRQLETGTLATPLTLVKTLGNDQNMDKIT